jgi:hypothetical protein
MVPRTMTSPGFAAGFGVFPEGLERYSSPPAADGYPDVDTYRDLEFYVEVH